PQTAIRHHFFKSAASEIWCDFIEFRSKDDMKIFTLFVITGLLAAGLTLQAGQREQGRGRRMDVEQRLSQMQKRLNLTSDQVNKIRPILQDQNRKMADLW